MPGLPPPPEEEELRKRLRGDDDGVQPENGSVDVRNARVTDETSRLHDECLDDGVESSDNVARNLNADIVLVRRAASVQVRQHHELEEQPRQPPEDREHRQSASVHGDELHCDFPKRRGVIVPQDARGLRLGAFASPDAERPVAADILLFRLVQTLEVPLDAVEDVQGDLQVPLPSEDDESLSGPLEGAGREHLLEVRLILQHRLLSILLWPRVRLVAPAALHVVVFHEVVDHLLDPFVITRAAHVVHDANAQYPVRDLETL
mmetsp:Transcript_50725/g.142012  ORF Transcript_50725/g.142012 Transcript_50725/m.142012 type:complete len:262 (+) Transcript_50725:1150-1935(+)